MEFKFDINEIFKDNIVEIGGNLIPPGFSGDKRSLWDAQSKVSQIVNAMGEASAAAQGLTKPITTSDRLRNSEHKLYLLVDQNANSGKGAVTGMLKIGEKGLYLFDKEGQHYQVSPTCVLDFYVHESRQRAGYGKRLFEHMLQREETEPIRMAIDRPTNKFLGFLNKHYGLNTPIKQMNNYVVFDGFFPNSTEQPALNSDRSPSSVKRQSANGLQSHYPASPYGRYGAPRPPCSIGQIIHDPASVIKRNAEPAGVRSEPVTNMYRGQPIPQSNQMPQSQVTQSTPNVHYNYQQQGTVNQHGQNYQTPANTGYGDAGHYNPTNVPAQQPVANNMTSAAQLQTQNVSNYAGYQNQNVPSYQQQPNYIIQPNMHQHSQPVSFVTQPQQSNVVNAQESLMAPNIVNQPQTFDTQQNNQANVSRQQQFKEPLIAANVANPSIPQLYYQQSLTQQQSAPEFRQVQSAQSVPATQFATIQQNPGVVQNQSSQQIYQQPSQPNLGNNQTQVGTQQNVVYVEGMGQNIQNVHSVPEQRIGTPTAPVQGYAAPEIAAQNAQSFIGDSQNITPTVQGYNMPQNKQNVNLPEQQNATVLQSHVNSEISGQTTAPVGGQAISGVVSQKTNDNQQAYAAPNTYMNQGGEDRYVDREVDLSKGYPPQTPQGPMPTTSIIIRN